MRSKMDPNFEGRCRACYLRAEFCGCGFVIPIPTRTRFVVVRHAHEAFKSTNSVRWAQLALPNLEIHSYETRLNLTPDFVETEGAWLLYPGAEQAALPKSPPERLIVLDGTWRQVRRMYRALPHLHALPRLSLTDGVREVARLRFRARLEQLSTLEAMADALERIEGEATAAPLRTLYARMVEGTQRGRGRALNSAGQGFPAPRGPVSP